jgi:putative flippase GtrA
MNAFKKGITPELLSYLIVGGLTAIVYFGFFALSIDIFNLDYRIGMSIAYFLAVSFHFLANRKFTFRADNDRLFHQSIRYLCVLLINYLFTLGAMFLLVDGLGFSTYLSAALSVLVTVGIGYFASKFWVFRNKESVSE